MQEGRRENDDARAAIELGNTNTHYSNRLVFVHKGWVEIDSRLSRLERDTEQWKRKRVQIVK